MIAPCVRGASHSAAPRHLSGRFFILADYHGSYRLFDDPRWYACETRGVTTPPSPIVAAFDLDGTLSKGGSGFKWLRCLSGRRATYFAAIGLARPLFVGALRSGSWADDAKERLFRRLLTGRDAEEVTTLSRTFAIRYFEEHGRPRVIERMNWHLQQGHDVVIVSASPQLYLDVVAEIFGVAGDLGTRLAVDARGQLARSYLGKNCRGPEKLRLLSEWTEPCQ